MSERPSFFPALPELYPKPPDVIPSAETPLSGRVPPPVEADGQTTAVAERPAAARAEGAAAPEQERVSLAGRVGQNPRVSRTPKGTLVARFPLGVKDEQDHTKTTWHQVYALRERAAQVRDSLSKGDPVEVIGYRQHRTITGRNGPRTIEEIYAHVIKKR